jgi:integrase
MDCWILGLLPGHPAEATVDDLSAIILRNRNQSSRASYHSWIRGLFRLLREDGLIPKDHTPDLDLPRVRRPKGQPRPFTREQMDRLRAEANQPFRDIITVASLTGLRAGELWALKGADLVHGYHGPELHVIGKGAKPAVIPAHPRVVEIIEGYGTLDRLWTRWCSPDGFSHNVSVEIRRVLGFGRLHMCRHFFATQVLDVTGDVTITQKLLRHSNVATTMVYAQVVESKTRAAVELLAG